MGDLVKGPIGPEANYDVAFVGGKLVLTLNYQGVEAGAGVNLSIGAKAVLEKLKSMIPQSAIRDEVFALLEASLPA